MDLASSSFSLVRPPLGFCSWVRRDCSRGLAGLLEGQVGKGEDRVEKNSFWLNCF